MTQKSNVQEGVKSQTQKQRANRSVTVQKRAD